MLTPTECERWENVRALMEQVVSSEAPGWLGAFHATASQELAKVDIQGADFQVGLARLVAAAFSALSHQAIASLKVQTAFIFN
jgi:hypothetical protein